MLLVLGLVSGLAAAGWVCWHPGLHVTDGRHDRGQNGIWLQHGWLGDDDWFVRNQRTNQLHFRDEMALNRLSGKLRLQNITDVFPHLCPCDHEGNLAGWDAAQTERFLDAFEGFRVMPWIGGVFRLHARPESDEWRAKFVANVRRLMEQHPRLAGIHLNIEPMPSGTEAFLHLLDELRGSLPEGKVLSVAAYPPPTRWQPTLEVHWEEAYFRAVAGRCDQVAVMMYDTALGSPKLYRHLMRDWTREVLAWSGATDVLLGVPAYDDADTGYHDPRVENLEHALAGIHAGLAVNGALPAGYQGVAIYSEWEMSAAEWRQWEAEFRSNESATGQAREAVEGHNP